MIRPSRIRTLLASLVLGSAIALPGLHLPAAHAAPSSHAAPHTQVLAAGLNQGSRVSPDLTIKICIHNHCIVIKF